MFTFCSSSKYPFGIRLSMWGCGTWLKLYLSLFIIHSGKDEDPVYEHEKTKVLPGHITAEYGSWRKVTSPKNIHRVVISINPHLHITIALQTYQMIDETLS